MADRVWNSAIVVGASSGIGAAIARQLAAAGTRVGLLARREPELTALAAELNRRHGENTALWRAHDVVDVAAVDALYAELSGELGEPDLFVFATGVLHVVGPDEYDAEKDVTTFTVNLTGAVAWLDCAARRMMPRGSGTIVGISSIAGDRGRRGNPAYCASKAGLTTFLEGLRNRLTQHGVNVVTVRPGYVATPMTEGMTNMFWVVSADRAAELTLRHARSGPVDRHVPARWGLVSLVIRLIPSFIFRRLSV